MNLHTFCIIEMQVYDNAKHVSFANLMEDSVCTKDGLHGVECLLLSYASPRS